MVIEYIRYSIPESRHREFEDAYARAAKYLSSAPQCVEYELAHASEEPGSYILRIVWTSAKDHTEGFRGGPNFAGFFAEVRPYFQEISEMRHYDRTAVVGAGGSVPTIYEWAGGEEAFSRLAQEFDKRVRSDPVIGGLFATADADFPRWLGLWLGQVLGGPEGYGSDRGGFFKMAGKHLGLAFGEPERRRWLDLMIDAADAAGLPTDPYFRAAFVGYLEWGSRIVQVNSKPGISLPADEPAIPQWGWGVAPPGSLSA